MLDEVWMNMGGAVINPYTTEYTVPPDAIPCSVDADCASLGEHCNGKCATYWVHKKMV